MTTSNSDPKNLAVAPEPESASAINVLVIGTDLGFAKSIQNILQGLKGPPLPVRLFPGTDFEKVAEQIEKHPFHAILVDEEFLTDRTPEQFLKSLEELTKKSPQNAKTSLVIITSKTDLERTKSLVRMGWRDVLLKPLDSSLFLQKMNLYKPETGLLKEPLLFTMEISKEVDLAFQFKTKSMSEYGMKVESAQPLAAGLVVGVLGAFLSTPLAAVVLESRKVGEGVFTIDLMFVGVTPAETQAIRKLIRQEYAEEKQAA